MVDQPENQLKHWQNLKTQAENGELVMEADIAGKLAQRCDTFVGQLNDAIDKAYDLQYVSGFGTLRSATQLSEKFANKAVSEEGSAVNRLKQSVQIVELMKATFELSAKKVGETDQQISQALGNTAP